MAQKTNQQNKSWVIKALNIPLIDRKTIAEKTTEFSLGLFGNEFNFRAGQYVRMWVPDFLPVDRKGNSRLFSIASSPNNKKELSFAFRDSNSSFKKTIQGLPSNSLIEIKGPYGFFTLPEDASKQIVFIAGGIGITPCLSMIRFATESNLPYKTTLIYANKNKESACYLEELEEISQKNKNFLLKNKFGSVTADLISKNAQNATESIYYVAGPHEMILIVKDALSSLRVKNEKMHFEDFSGY